MTDSRSRSLSKWDVKRPLLNKAIFGVALLGILLSVHLFIQEQRGFASGCTGFEGAEAGSFNCAAVLESPAAQLFGVSNVIWGFLFYAVVAALSAGLIFATYQNRDKLKQLRAGLIGFGVLYSVYLLYYQFASVGEFCLLCLISALLVATLAVLAYVDYSGANPEKRRKKKQAAGSELSVYGGMLAALIVLVGADYAYFAQQGDDLSGDDAMEVADGCYYDPDHQPIQNYEQLISGSDAFVGDPESDVTVMEFFDPNCPACRHFHPVMMQTLQRHVDDARFVFKPMALWDYSINQIAALHVATEQGKFFDMLRAQYERQQQGGLSNQQVLEIAAEIDMDPDQLAERLQSQQLMNRVQIQRQQASAAGINSTPSVVVNGRLVHHESRSPDCMGAFIEHASES